MEKIKKFFSDVRNIFCYCGLTKEEYKTVKKEAYVSNFDVWKYLSIAMMVFGCAVTVLSLADEGITFMTFARMVFTGYSIVSTVLLFLILKRESIIGQIIIYLNMIVLLVYGLFDSIFEPDMMAVTFVVLLVLLPMFMLDKPYFMMIVIILAVIINLAVVKNIKTPVAYHHDFVNLIFFGILGMAINTFYNCIRVKAIVLRKEEESHIQEQKKANEETLKLNNTLKSLSEGVVELLGDIVEGRDLESGEHIQRVKGFSYILANQVMMDLPEYGLDSYTVDLITFTSALHDVGKIYIPDSILLKPGKLTAEEFEVMKTHSANGVKVINKMQDKWSDDYLKMSRDICLYHHEKWDGRGYPEGLKGDEIPIAAQIVSIADVYDALTTKRVYKDAISPDEAYRMIMEGECGAYSEKLLSCFSRCRKKFAEHAENEADFKLEGRTYELVSKANPDRSFVIGLHDQDKAVKDKAKLLEQVSVLQSISEKFLYICYVNMETNEVIRFSADERLEKIIRSFGDDIPSNKKFDLLLNSIIVKDDYDEFRKATDRDASVEQIRSCGHMLTDFRIRLEDGVHYCRMRISADPNDSSAVIIGITNRDEEHEKEQEYAALERELAVAKKEVENREKLEDRLAVIDCLSSEYDYVCSLNAETMEVTVYRAVDWIRDMFKNLEDIVVSPEARDKTLRGIIVPEDFEQFQIGSKHENVLRGLAANGTYAVDYRAYKYGKLLNYQTRYTVDPENPKRIIIGLHSV